jgi:hypothetical protein
LVLSGDSLLRPPGGAPAWYQQIDEDIYFGRHTSVNKYYSRRAVTIAGKPNRVREPTL